MKKNLIYLVYIFIAFFSMATDFLHSAVLLPRQHPNEKILATKTGSSFLAHTF